MSITWQSAGAVAYSASSGAGSVVPAYPSSIAAGDLLILIVGMKPSAANSGSVTTPSGWTALTPITGAGGYSTTLGADTGNTNLFGFWKIADGTESGTLSVSLSTSDVSWATIHRLSNTTGKWSVASATGSDTSAGNVSIGFGSDPGVQVGDYIVAAMCIPTDVTTPSQFSSEALSQTGITFGTVTEVTEPDSGTGNDIGGFIVRAAVSAGKSSAAPTLTATAGGTTTNVRGPGIFIRARELGATGQSLPKLGQSVSGTHTPPQVVAQVLATHAVANFAVDGASFDGTNDYLTRGAGFTGASDSSRLLLSFWYRTSSFAADCLIIGSAADLVGVGSFGGDYQIYVNDPLGSSQLLITATISSEWPADGNWHHVLVAIDTNFSAGNKIAQIYLDDAPLSSTVNDTSAAFSIDFTQTNWSVGGYVDSQFKFTGDLAEVFYAPGQILDLSITANRRKFIDASGKPVDLGADGSTPTGTMPVLYLHLDDGETANNFATNAGSGGGMTVNGALATSGASPSDGGGTSVFAFVQAASGTSVLRFSGTAAQTLKQAAAAASGTSILDVAGAIAAGLPRSAQLLTGTERLIAAASAQLGLLAQSATSTERFSGSVAALLGHMGQAASAMQRVVGGTAAVLTRLAQALTARETILGSVAGILRQATQAAAAKETITAGTAALLGRLAQSLGATARIAGGISAALGPAAQSASAKERAVAAVAGVLGRVVLSAAALERISGTVAAGLAQIRQALTVTEQIRGQAGLGLARFTQAISASFLLPPAIVTQILPKLRQVLASLIVQPLPPDRRSAETWGARTARGGGARRGTVSGSRAARTGGGREARVGGRRNTET